MEKILSKLDKDQPLTHAEAVQAAQYFYPKLQQVTKNPGTFDDDIQQYIQNKLTWGISSAMWPKRLKYMAGFSMEELTAVFEKYSVLSGTAKTAKTPDTQPNGFELRKFLSKNEMIEPLLLKHAAAINTSGTFQDLRASLIGIVNRHIEKEQAEVPQTIAQNLSAAQAEEIVNAASILRPAGNFTGNYATWPTRELQISPQQAAYTMQAYNLDRADQALDPKSALYNFFLTRISFPKESYDFKHAAIDKTLADFTDRTCASFTGFTFPPQVNNGTLVDVCNVLETLSAPQRQDFLQTVSDRFCRYADIPVVPLKVEKLGGISGVYRSEAVPPNISIDADKLTHMYHTPALNSVLLFEVLFHELDHHVNHTWEKHYIAAALNSNAFANTNPTDFKDQTGLIIHVCNRSYDRSEGHDYMPIEKSANLIGHGYAGRRIHALLDPTTIDKQNKYGGLRMDDAPVLPQYYKEFDAAGLGTDLGSPTTPAAAQKQAKSAPKHTKTATK